MPPLTLQRTRQLSKVDRLQIVQTALEEQENRTYDPTEFEATKTTYLRDNVWNLWMLWVEDTRCDNVGHWTDFCLGKDSAAANCLAFIANYIDQSWVSRPCLGPEEWKTVRTVNSAITVQTMWIALLRRVDEKILRKKRHMTGESRWQALVSSQSADYAGSPVARMSKAITKLCLERGLTTHQTFTKRDLSEEDVLLILSVLWLRGEHIPCIAATRLAFHSAVLLGGIGGFRPASVMNLPYSNVEFALLRDSGRTGIMATITIDHVKQRSYQVQRHQRSSLTFSIGLAPYGQICLLSCLLARALADNAFQAEFLTLEQMLQHNLEPHIELLPLRWKDSMCNKAIIPIGYTTYWSHWNRTLFVAGLRNEDNLRPYALRVTAGQKLDGSLTRAAANFIMSHSTSVFEMSYQSPHIKADLMKIAFGERSGDHEEQIAKMRSVFSRRDPFSPIYLTCEELAEFDERDDISTLRRQYRKIEGTDKELETAISNRIRYITNVLERLKLREKRAAYFAAVDDLRARGQSTAHLRCTDEKNPRIHRLNPGGKSSVAMGEYMQKKHDWGRPRFLFHAILKSTISPNHSSVLHAGERHQLLSLSKQGFFLGPLMWKRFTENIGFQTQGCGINPLIVSSAQRIIRACEKNGKVVAIPDKSFWVRHAIEIHGSQDQICGSVLISNPGQPKTKKRKYSLTASSSQKGATTGVGEGKTDSTIGLHLDWAADGQDTSQFDEIGVIEDKQYCDPSWNACGEDLDYLTTTVAEDEEYWVTGRSSDYPELED
ncbi:hypothetical protein NLG97_g8046 [Lecanicillium saksenae]|uniref:Uncharacterized protein n=1 Tax=Lecanicillium saksenae TaxID=468837 RepID=A0ACC1QL79_9HYPO|nr:hypothetical protein NLG97_g8046 [Lecanicillium saksenae]